MEIATRESQLLITMYYKDGCTKKIYILKYYAGNENTPNFIWKMVEYIHPDGTIDEKRSNTYRENMDESDTEYENQNILVRKRMAEILTTIYYNDGCTKTIKIRKIYLGQVFTPFTYYNSAEFKYPNCTIDKKRSKYNKQYINKIGESEFKCEKCFRFAFEINKFKNI